MNNIVKFGVGRGRRGRRPPSSASTTSSDQNVGGPGIGDPSPTPAATPAALPAEGIVPAGTYVVTPFTGERTAASACLQAGCSRGPGR